MVQIRPVRLVIVGAVVLAATVATTSLADPFGRGALRSVVAACVVAKATLGVPFPCTDVKPDAPGADGYAVIRSPGFASEVLITTLAPLDGIEAPELRTPAATGIWQAAWAARTDVGAALGRSIPSGGVALAVNAAGMRTQDHFHIHVDCLRPSVRTALSGKNVRISDDWAQLKPRLMGESYWARAIDSPDLSGVNVPDLIAAAPPAATQPMKDVTLAIVEAKLADGQLGFYLLANWQDTSAEVLLDHSCKVAPVTS